MKARQLVKMLNAMIKQHGDKDILIIDGESGWYDTVGDVKLKAKNEWDHNEGFLLDKVEH